MFLLHLQVELLGESDVAFGVLMTFDFDGQMVFFNSSHMVGNFPKNAFG